MFWDGGSKVAGVVGDRQVESSGEGLGSSKYAGS